MTVQKFLFALFGGLFILLLAAVGAILVNWYWQLGLHPGVCAGAAAGAAFVGAIVWSIVFRASRMDAAIELDRRYGLKERVSSTLSLSSSERETPAGRAVTADALRRVQNVSVRERFGLRLGRWALLPVLPAVAAFLLALFLPELHRQDKDAKAKNLIKPAVMKQTVVDPLKKQLEQARKEAAAKGLKDLEEELKKLYRDIERDLASDKPMDRKEAMQKLNDMARQLEERRNKLDAGEEIKKQMEELKNLGQGPGDDLAKALKDGDFKKAADEIAKMMNDLKDGKLDPKKQEELANRLNEIKKRLDQIAKDHEQKKQNLQQQIEQAKKQGDQAKAQQLQQQLDQLNQKDKQMQQMQKMSQQLGQCAKCLGQGDPKGAQAGLQGMQAELQDLQQQLEELKMLDQALANLAECKGCLGECEGEGEGQGEGKGKGKGRGKGKGKGDGLGEGQGQGERPEEKTEGNKSVNSNVKGKPQPKGAQVLAGEADGPNARGKTVDAINKVLETAKSKDSDPLTGHRLPKDVGEHVEQYYNKLREGK
jgi:hypothetical protein